MNSAAKIIVVICLLGAVLAGAIFFLLQPDSQPVVQPPAPRVQEDPPPVPSNDPVVAPEPVRVEQPASGRTTVRVESDQGTGGSLPQGVLGRVLTPAGLPLEGALVFLMRSASADPIEIFLANKRGEIIPPVATGKTDGEGRFRLGTQKPGTAYDVRVITDSYPELHHRSVRIKDNDWYDAGDLRLETGVVVQGRVIEEGTMVPIPGAKVHLQSTNAAHTLLATPGREKGLPAETDAGGFFRYDNAPRNSTISLSAEAPGFARVEKLNLVLQQEAPNEFNIELARGLSIIGYVVSTQGAPVPGAKVTATALSSKVPQTAQADTDRDGRFELFALREGPFQLMASAPQYEEKTERPILAGAQDVRLILEQRGMARVRVLARTGAAIKDFTLSLKRSFPNNPLGIGNVPEFRDQRVTPRDFEGDFYLVKGIPNGDFVFQIAANNHARTLSAPFTIAAGGPVPEVVVEMTMGGVILGRVVDDRGNPVAGATVSTDMNGGFAAETDFGALFKQFMPDRITKTSTRTAADGRYRLPLLAYGDYMLRVAHADYCEGTAVNVKVESETEIPLPDIRLVRGTIVRGLAMVDGQPAGQVKIQIGPPMGQTPELDENGMPKMTFMSSCLSDSDGRFQFLKRVPPGNYQIHASKQAGDNNPFVTLLQVKQTARDLQVLAGQEVIEQNFNIPRQ